MYARVNKVFFLQLFKLFHVNQLILYRLYTSRIENVINCNIIVWLNSLVGQNQNKTNRIYKQARKIIQLFVTIPSTSYRNNVCTKVSNILKHNDHMLSDCYVYMRSGTRLGGISCRTQRYGKSLIPDSVTLFNNM